MFLKHKYFLAAEFQELLDVPPVPDPEESDAVWSDVEIEMSNG